MTSRQQETGTHIREHPMHCGPGITRNLPTAAAGIVIRGGGASGPDSADEARIAPTKRSPRLRAAGPRQRGRVTEARRATPGRRAA